MNFTSATDILTQARQRADMVNSKFITDDEIYGWMNQSYYELYDILVQKYGENYFVKTGSFTTDGTTSQFYIGAGPMPTGSQYSLPANGGLVPGPVHEDFYKLLGVDGRITPGPADDTDPQAWITLRPFNFADRNRFVFGNPQPINGPSNMRYRINGDYLWLTPTPSADQAIRYWYIPRPAPLAPSQSLTFPAGHQWSGDPNGPDQFFLGSRDPTTQGVTFEAYTPVTDNSIDFGTLTGYIDVGELAVQINDQYHSANYPNILSASVSGGNVATGSVLLTDPFGNPIAFSTYASSSDASLVITSRASTNIWWDVSSQSRVIFGYPRATLWSGAADSVSGWIEYVIVDVAIKMLQKEESDPSVLMAQKQGLLVRIESAAANRNVGDPMTVTDSRRNDWGSWGQTMSSGNPSLGFGFDSGFDWPFS